MKSSLSQETRISRTMLMLIGFAVLSVGALVYVLPFQKTSLQINYYYKIIEYVTMSVTLVLFILSLVNCKIKASIDFSKSILTPKMLAILSGSAFVSSVIIPLSGSRHRYSKVSIIAFVFVFLCYATYYFVNKAFTYQSAICGIYFIMLKLFGDYYTTNVTFEDKIHLSYTWARIIFALVIVTVIVVTYIINRRIPNIVLWHTAVLSAVPALALIVRFFVSEYVILSSLIAIILVYLSIIILTKIRRK